MLKDNRLDWWRSYWSKLWFEPLNWGTNAQAGNNQKLICSEQNEQRLCVLNLTSKASKR